MVSAPRNMVSSRPRARSSRSVKTWPRSGSAQSWISSTARKLVSRSLGHRLDGGDEIASPRRLDALLAGDQRDRAGAALGGDPVVDLARQQAQRKADQAAAVGQHALDREVGLAGVGRPEHGEHARAFERHRRDALSHALTIGGESGRCKGPVSRRRGADRGALLGSQVRPRRPDSPSDRPTQRWAGLAAQQREDLVQVGAVGRTIGSPSLLSGPTPSCRRISARARLESAQPSGSGLLPVCAIAPRRLRQRRKCRCARRPAWRGPRAPGNRAPARVLQQRLDGATDLVEPLALLGQVVGFGGRGIVADVDHDRQQLHGAGGIPDVAHDLARGHRARVLEIAAVHQAQPLRAASSRPSAPCPPG